MSRRLGNGLLGNSDGSAADRGVLRPVIRFVDVLKLGVWAVVGVLSEGRLAIRVGVFRAGSVGLGEAEGMMAFFRSLFLFGRGGGQETVMPNEGYQ